MVKKTGVLLILSALFVLIVSQAQGNISQGAVQANSTLDIDLLRYKTEVFALKAQIESQKNQIKNYESQISSLNQRTCSGSFLSSSNHDGVGTYSCRNNIYDRTSCQLEFFGNIEIAQATNSNSMLPASGYKDIEFYATWLEPKIGDFIVLKNTDYNGDYVGHQIIEKTSDGQFITKGVNNPTRDMVAVRRDNIEGVVVSRLIGMERA